MAHTDTQPPAMAACNRLIATIQRSLEMERTARPAGDSAIRVPWLRYALAQLRQRICPALTPGWLEADPVHVVMFGGTNSGKSTVLNVLLDGPAAGMSYRARFSQHPEAFRPAGIGNAFLEAYPTRFPDYERFTDEDPPQRTDRQLREQGYRYAVAIIDPDTRRTNPTTTNASAAVFWDIPDFSTEEALAYMPAVLDTVGLADLVVMTVTKENYADHRGNLLRAMICASGVPMRVVANKLEDGSRLLDDIRMKLADSNNGTCRIPPDRLHPLPYVADTDELGRLHHLATGPAAAQLRQAIAADIAQGPTLKKQALTGAIGFLRSRLDDLLAPLQAELSATEHWHWLVDRITRNDFYDRYQRDYLDGEKYVDFNQTLVKLLDMLEVPGIGPIISAASKGLRTISSIVFGPAVSIVRGFFSKGQPNTGTPEKDVVAVAFERWLHTLRSEAQIQAERGEHPAWPAIARKLSDYDYIMDLARKVGTAYLEYRQEMDAITDKRARALYEVVQKNPALLHSLRGLKLVLDAGTTSLIVASHGLNWTDAIVGPLVIPVQRLLLEFGVERYMDVQKAKLKEEQFKALREMIETHMVTPIRQLFVGAVSPREMAQAHEDFNTVAKAIAKVTS